MCFVILENFDIWKIDNFDIFVNILRENFVLETVWRVRSFDIPNEIKKSFRLNSA